MGLSNAVNNADVLTKDLAMQVASMGATTLSYKDFDPSFVASETEARIAVIEKENIELGRLGKTLKNVPQYIYAQLSDDVLAQAKETAKAELKAEESPSRFGIEFFQEKWNALFLTTQRLIKSNVCWTKILLKTIKNP